MVGSSNSSVRRRALIQEGCPPEPARVARASSNPGAARPFEFLAPKIPLWRGQKGHALSHFETRDSPRPIKPAINAA